MSLTKTTEYLLNMTGLSFVNLKNNGFINAYVGDAMHEPHYDYCIYLRLKPNYNEKFTSYLKRLRQSDYYITDYDLPEDELMVVISVNYTLWDTFDNFLLGKYSKMDRSYISSKFKPEDKRFRICFQLPDIRSKLEQDLNIKLPADAELDSKPLKDVEIFRYKIKEEF